MSKNSVKGESELTPEQYAVCWQQATEQPYSGKYLYHNEKGLYVCCCCGAELFSSEAKYEAGCGWPSFSEAVSDEAIQCQEDLSHGMVRTEVRCHRCGSHLGHLFDDGPAPTGKRYCINSLSLDFVND